MQAGGFKTAEFDTKPIRASLARLFWMSPDWLALAFDGIRVVCANAATWAPPLARQQGWRATYPHFGLQFEFVYGWVQGVEKVLFTRLFWCRPGTPLDLVTHIEYVSLGPGSPYVRGDLPSPALNIACNDPECVGNLFPALDRRNEASTRRMPGILVATTSSLNISYSPDCERRNLRQARIFLPQHVPRSLSLELSKWFAQLLSNSMKDITMEQISTGILEFIALPHSFMYQHPNTVSEYNNRSTMTPAPSIRDTGHASPSSWDGGRQPSHLPLKVEVGAEFMATSSIAQLERVLASCPSQRH
ncbi:hypothetical protein LAV84_27690 [Rhizobium sp. VS19-DR104.2]|uniref:hypothetical protein n=1 Tax=unclassified Rhizobium TaxID=2613769 RepID=UPI001CC33C46|nr:MULTISPECIES: hypothetical protein [unclassified Rhizobium]MBZ5763036.1 hypothetical protein [Rhizobium sp. VS19-DR96]MBZ5768815.1 hypothetical protein [Rhizobium sp. VS19-DR129.2]MBZ5776344.1 hypothetical protein [Rhizobium sp. VS19-DRK62.2]MBZ5787552.1 hypothetical protein [Rhizobium sp. VS19-DR121]MBZ5804907.1 hypothetical protein [Rhizobium sp. VS19-DR181]